MDTRDDAPGIPAGLLAAAEQLWARESPSRVTMRRIAQEAGVSTGLAYNYVHSKDELSGAVLTRIGERLSEAVDIDRGGEPALRDLWRVMEDSPAFTRLMATMVLEGRNTSRVMSRYPMVADVASAARELGARDPELVAGVLAFLGIGMQTYETLVNRAMGSADGDDRLKNAIATMFRAWFDAQFEDAADDHQRS